MKKGCLIASAIGFVLLMVAAAVIFLVFRLTKPVVDEGERFLAALGGGSPAAAYGMASASLRASQSAEDFERTVKAFGLEGYRSANWSNRKIQNDRGTLEGTVVTKAGGSVPLELELIKEGGGWKVLAIRGPQAGAATHPAIDTETTPAAAPPLAAPGPEVAKPLALATLLAFNQAVQSKSFDSFHANISGAWQRQITAAKLLEIFRPFIDAGIDIEPIRDLEPVFASPPALDEDGVLVIEGHYPTTPNKVYFKLKYLAEGGAWKLLGINVNVNE